MWQCITLLFNIADNNENNSTIGVHNGSSMIGSECCCAGSTKMASELPNDGIKCRDTHLRPLRRRREGDEVCRDNIDIRNTPRSPLMDYDA